MEIGASESHLDVGEQCQTGMNGNAAKDFESVGGKLMLQRKVGANKW